MINVVNVLSQTNTDSFEQTIQKSKNDTLKIKLYIQLSKDLLSEKPEKSLEIALKTQDLIKNRANDRYKALSLMQIANCQIQLFKKDEALENINLAIAIFQQIGNEYDLSEAFCIKGNVYESLTEYAKAIELFNISLNFAQKLSNYKEISNCHLNLGMVYYKVDNLDKAFENFNKTLKIDSLTNNKEGLAKVYVNIGMLYNQKGDYQKCLEYYNKSYPLLIELNNKRELAKLLVNIGNVYSQLKEYSKAMINYRHSIQIKQKIHDNIGIANTYNNIGVLFMQMNKKDSVLHYLNTALKTYLQLDDKRSIAMSYGNIGAVYRSMGRETEALIYLNKAIELRLKIDDIKGAGRSYLSIGYLYDSKNNLHKSIYYYKKALECGEKSKDERLMMESFLKLSSIYEKQNNFTKALQYYQKYHTSFDSIYNHQKQKQLLDLQTKYETVQKDNEIKLLNNQNEINSLNIEKTRFQLQKQKTLITIVSIIVLLLAVFSFVYYRLFKQKQRANRILQEKQIEIKQQNIEILSQRDSLETLNNELKIQKQLVTNQRDIIEEELKKTLLSSEILQRENIQFKFEALKNQLNPHFLFNTYSTLISLIPADPILAEKYTRNLSSVYRYILTGKDKELVKLSEEIDFVCSYMFLISIRFSDQVKLIIEIEKEKFDYFIPLLSLQLLIENAIKHNVISAKKPLAITIKNIDTSLIVENNLQKKSSIENSTKIGLQNIIKRYQLICSEKVEIEQTDTHFSVKLPLIKENAYL